MELRPYQQAAVAAIEEGWSDGSLQKSLLVLPTGTGKTVVFCTVARHRAGCGRVLILAHRDELIEQARRKYYSITGELAAKEKAGETCIGDPAPVVVGSVQTLQNVKRLEKFPADAFNTIIIDEAHHALSAGYQRVLGHFPAARVLGVTATPDRGDKRNLAEFFDGVAYEYPLKQAIKDGYLCPIQALTAPLTLDVSEVKSSRTEYGGDLDKTQLAQTLEQYLPQIARSIKEYAGDRKTVVFLPLISIAQQFRDELNAVGLTAREVNGQSDDRAETLEWFNDAPAGSVLCNAMLLTEGWDCPSVDCVVVLRPTKVRALYAQMIGRGTRLSPGKENLLILDFLWLSGHHDLCRPASLVSEDPAIAARVTEAAQDTQLDLLDAAEAAEQQADEDAAEQRRQSLAKALDAARKRPKRLINPLDYAAFVGELDAGEPVFKWETLPATDKQKAFLDKQGLDTDGLTRGRAKHIIDSIMRRIGKQLATVKQIRALERAGYIGVKDWPLAEASARITELAAAGWNPTRLRKSPAQYNRERALDALFS